MSTPAPARTHAEINAEARALAAELRAITAAIRKVTGQVRP